MKNNFNYYFLLLAFLLINCNKAKAPETKKEQPLQNIAILIDNSISMVSRDFAPDRITVMKEVLKNIIDHKKENQAFSIVIYSGNSYILCPLTKDKNQLLSAVNKLSLGMLKLRPGTNFSNPLLNGIFSLSSAFDHKSMILFTDGKENIKSYPLDIPIQDAVKNNIRVNTILFTSKDFVMAPTQMDLNGNFVFSKVKVEIDSTQLKQISSETGGIFKTFYTKDDFTKYDFNTLISQEAHSNKKATPEINNEQLSKIYKQIEKTNDSMAIKFK
ncbi:VWA domain-containing protein [Chryseobacterium sp. RG1]|uniref:VWA domain-containing protein n=1 Tax=Chryseobacterium tagetis TaxID=2801334 RepID=A0ABS8A467_9FLAO|nr:VWA domain-containing protein [Chryseobacterium tagetis]MCA6067680.1 VWA domain-containing protein [Chryseobacterium tagetis]